MPEFSVATFNLCQFCTPGERWFQDGDSIGYDPEAWAKKCDFIRQALDRMQADIVGFQEVFSPDAFRVLMTEAGYPHVAIPDTPPRRADASGTLVAPVNALVSRHPILSAGRLDPPTHLWSAGLLAEDFHFRRGVVEARIAIPGLSRPLLVLVCHLKSPGVGIDDAAVAKSADWRGRFRSHLHQRAVLDAAQIIHRTGEAMMLHTAVMHRIDREPGLPVIVMGDLNDTPDSTTLRILTQAEPVPQIAGTVTAELPPAERAHLHDWRLYPARAAVGASSPRPRPTLAGFGKGATFDHILVGNALNGENPAALAQVTGHAVFDAHLLAGANPLETSDHAPVRATFKTVTRD
ncbi:endonuclease/exonuclease/phosphatase family protein [Thetidibacter halocola]|uniref:Endonuclease/exonuclease/phosphatase family protein n=1 Tax=Thetidibacter halocola TaxID=2827239 RepID=A0A8J7WFS6_9RHOB|nr:endonuclease/exonuclease/phosphatase family protein [Thetidibacter halocola]MBS0124523.1 endonuclease/exonuclease/phosphatase family protein [Thetidibacter halocola]